MIHGRAIGGTFVDTRVHCTVLVKITLNEGGREGRMGERVRGSVKGFVQREGEGETLDCWGDCLALEGQG